jgi:hypothetical protein
VTGSVLNVALIGAGRIERLHAEHSHVLEEAASAG